VNKGDVVRRAALLLCSLAALSVLSTGCGGDDESSSAAPAPSAPASSAAPASPTEASSTSAAPSAAALPAGCSAPTADVEYKTGQASLDVTSGPGQGHYDLTLDDSRTAEFASSDKEITGQWQSADEKAVLFVDIEGADPCTPDAFVKIGTEGPGGPQFVDSSHTACTVQLPSLGAAGAQGSFTCSKLAGGGEGVTIDAKGDFTLLP
jgi:hypothetical protein